MLNEEEIAPGWYVGIKGIGVSGPYESKEAAMAGFDPNDTNISVEYIGNESMNEVLYTDEQPASDPVIEQPLKDAVKDITVVLKDIDWDIDSIISASSEDDEDEVRARDDYDLAMSPEQYAASSDEDDFIGDDDANKLYSLIQNLPNEITLYLDSIDLGNNIKQAKQAILKAANEQSPYQINDAIIASIQ